MIISGLLGRCGLIRSGRLGRDNDELGRGITKGLVGRVGLGRVIGREKSLFGRVDGLGRVTGRSKGLLLGRVEGLGRMLGRGRIEGRVMGLEDGRVIGRDIGLGRDMGILDCAGPLNPPLGGRASAVGTSENDGLERNSGASVMPKAHAEISKTRRIWERRAISTSLSLVQNRRRQ